MITLDQLQKFCAHNEPLRNREHLQPLRYCGHIYATDDRICIRINDDQTLEVNGIGVPGIDYAVIFAGDENCDLPIPQLPASIPCSHCHGTAISHDCPECDGDGGGCSSCDRTGKLKTPHLSAGPCWWCNGRGEQENNPIAIGDIFFNRIYLALAAEMPGARFVRIEPLSSARIVFDGGEIAIMPTRAKP